MQPTDYRWTATQRSGVSSGRSKKWFLRLLAVNAILLGYSWLHSRGADVDVVTNVDGAGVSLGGDWRQGKAVKFERVPYGKHQLQVEHPWYEPQSIEINAGWFGGRSHQFTLKPRPVELTVSGTPGAQVSVDGSPAGLIPESGQMTIRGLKPGDHAVSAKLAGYREMQARQSFAPPAASVGLFLEPTPEKLQQLEEQRQRAATLIERAQELFGGRQYRAALDAVEESLRLEPGNGYGQQLKARIADTMQVLGVK